MRSNVRASRVRPEVVLVLDADRGAGERLASEFVARGHAVAEAAGGEPEVALLSLALPRRWGRDAVDELCRRHPSLRLVVVTGYPSVMDALGRLRARAVCVAGRPTDAATILSALRLTDGGTAPEPPRPAASLARTEWEHIQRTLAETGGNVSEAARRLGLHRQSLQRKLRKRPPP
jgi:two-component system response regulator RegA